MDESSYFFMEGDGWMCHPGDQEFMPFNKTWGIMPSSSMHLSAFRFLIVFNFTCYLTVSFCNPGLSTSFT